MHSPGRDPYGCGCAGGNHLPERRFECDCGYTAERRYTGRNAEGDRNRYTGTCCADYRGTAYTYSHANTDPHANTDTYAYTDAYTYSHANADTHSDTYPDADADSHADADAFLDK